jgi:hypothetical protein
MGVSSYEALDGPKDATKGNGGGATADEDLECNIDASSELDLRDAIIKLVRLIANLSIDYDVGLQIGSDRENLQVRSFQMCIFSSMHRYPLARFCPDSSLFL